MTVRSADRRTCRGPVRAGRALVAGFAVVVVLISTAPVVAASVGGPAPTRQSEAEPLRIEVTAASPWVPADGDFRVEMRTSAAPPAGSTIRTSIHQRLRPPTRGTLRDALDDVLEGGDLPKLLQAPSTRPVADLGDPSVGVVLDIPVRSSRSQPDDRVLLPTTGIHPVTIDLLDPAGTQLATTTVFLNHLPDRPAGVEPGADTMAVLLSTVVDGPASIGPTGASQLTDASREALNAVASLLTTTPQAPLLVAVRPTLLSALNRATDARDRRTAQLLHDAWRAPGRAFVAARSPEVPIDTGGLATAAGGSAEVLRQIAFGDQAVHEAFGVEPTGATWLDDPTVTTTSLGLLEGLGVRRLLIGADRLRPSGRGTDRDDLTTRSLRLVPSGPDTTAPDTAIARLLSAKDRSTGVRANQVTTALMASWFDAAEAGGQFVAPVAVVPVAPTTEPAVLQALLPAFAAPGPLRADPTLVPEVSPGRGGQPLAAELTARTPPDQGAAVRAVIDTRRLIDGFRSLAPAATTEAAEWELIDAQTLDRSMGAAMRSTYHDHVRDGIDALVDRIEMPKERHVVLTSRRSTIPLRFRNGLSYPVTLVLQTRSGRLDIGGGPERTVTLQPGENRIDLQVTTRAPGGTLLRLGATSPDGTIRLPFVAIPVTSSTISGVGATLSVLSLLVLAGWWVLSVRRRRQERRGRRRARRRQAIEEAVDADGPQDPPGDPDAVAPPPPGDADSVHPGG